MAGCNLGKTIEIYNLNSLAKLAVPNSAKAKNIQA
jgi:hypothetical protein